MSSRSSSCLAGHDLLALLGAEARGEARGAVGRPGLERLEDILRLAVEGVGQLVDGWAPAQVVGELLAGRLQLEVQVLEATAHPHRPRAVAEVPSQLADDGGDRERREPHVEGGIEAIDRLHEREVRDLGEVVRRLATTREATRAVPGQPEVLLDQLIAELGITGACAAPRTPPVRSVCRRTCGVVDLVFPHPPGSGSG